VTDVRGLPRWVWRNRRNVLFWAVFVYLVILAVVLAVGSIPDATVGPTAITGS
jgi:hypothetical protein